MPTGGKSSDVKNRVTNVHQAPKLSETNSDEDESNKLVLWCRPCLTSYHFIQEVVVLLESLWKKLCENTKLLLYIVTALIFIYVLSLIKGPQQAVIVYLQDRLTWSLYWLGLGVLSSIGLGSGLHTFILYLGPHIAAVTLAAYQCGCLNFPEPPYPQQIVCPEKLDPLWVVSVWHIMWKVKLEAFMWGAGTAIGELPPYLMARAAKQSGRNEDDEIKELENLQKLRDSSDVLSTIDRIKLTIQHLIEKVGFFGILLCASIPNPLFDLAGITCGHFEVPFQTFFGATLLGKTVIKMTLQTFFVIVAFSDTLINKILNTLLYIPEIGTTLQETFLHFLEQQKEKLYQQGDAEIRDSKIESVYQIFILSMIVVFVVSIVHSLALNNYKRSNNASNSTKKRK